MALTHTADAPDIVSGERVVRGTITFDSSYATGGETFDIVNIGLTMLSHLTFAVGTSGYVPVWNRSTSAPEAQAFYGDNNNASDGPLIEVPSTTDLSAVTVGYTAIGY